LVAHQAHRRFANGISAHRHLWVIFPLWVVVAAVASAVLALVSTVRYIALSPDSTVYLSAGLNLADKGALRSWKAVPLTLYGPGLPGLIAFGHIAGLSAETASRLINIASFPAVVLLTYVLARRHLRMTSAITFVTILVAFSPVFLSIFIWAWSEPPFLAVTLAFIVVIETLVVRWSREPWLWAVAIALSWCGFLLRYSGLCLSLAGALAIVVAAPRAVRSRTRLVRAGLFMAGALVIPAAWMVRNYSTDGTLLGPRPSGVDSPALAVKSSLRIVGGWFLPHPPILVPPRSSVETGVALLIGLCLILVWFLRGARRRLGAILVIWTLIFAAVIVASDATSAVDVPNNRLLSPIYVPMLILVLLGLETLILDLRAPYAPRVVPCLLGAAVLGIGVGQLDRTGRLLQSQIQAQRARYPGSALRVRVQSLDGRWLFASDPYRAWLATRYGRLAFSPRTKLYRSNDKPHDLRFFRAALGCGPTYFLWFPEDRLASSPVRRYAGLVELARSAGVRLYRLIPKRRPHTLEACSALTSLASDGP
jgi:hypothetical protein